MSKHLSYCTIDLVVLLLHTTIVNINLYKACLTVNFRFLKHHITIWERFHISENFLANNVFISIKTQRQLIILQVLLFLRLTTRMMSEGLGYRVPDRGGGCGLSNYLACPGVNHFPCVSCYSDFVTPRVPIIELPNIIFHIYINQSDKLAPRDAVQ